MRKKYLFQYRSFWVVLSTIYLVLFLANHVQVNIDPAFWVMEPTYHLILRKAGIVQGSQFSYYSDSLAPVTYNLPYFALAIVVLSLVIVFITFVVQYLYRVFK